MSSVISVQPLSRVLKAVIQSLRERAMLQHFVRSQVYCDDSRPWLSFRGSG